MRPRPVVYTSLMALISKISPPVGKSGPLMCSSRSSIVASDSKSPIKRRASSVSGLLSCFWVCCEMGDLPFLIKEVMAAATSLRLWGGILVAMPTAIPSAPISKRFGSKAGMTVGSCCEASKLSAKGTVSFSISLSNS